MPIGKGQAWGGPGRLPPDGVVVDSDAGARHIVEKCRARQEAVPVLGLAGGDLWRTLGGGAGGAMADAARLRSEDAMSFTVDLGLATLDGAGHVFVAHVIAHSRSWRRALAAMNAQWRGSWDLGPRSHPNDGLLDIYDVQLPFGELWKVRARLATGSHLPHPGIRERRVASLSVEFRRQVLVELDGEAVGRFQTIELGIEPDAIRVVV